MAEFGQNFLKCEPFYLGSPFDIVGHGGLTHMNFEKFTIKSQEALQKSAEVATSRQQQAIEPAHVLKAVLDTDENVVDYLIKKLNVNRTILESKLDGYVFHDFF